MDLVPKIKNYFSFQLDWSFPQRLTKGTSSYQGKWFSGKGFPQNTERPYEQAGAPRGKKRRVGANRRHTNEIWGE